MELKPGYKQTDVGVIPEEWEVRKLGTLLEQARTARYGIVQPGKFEPNGCLMLRSQDYSKGWADPNDMHRVNSQIESQYQNARIHRGDLIMTIVGAGIGQVVIAPAWLDGAILSRSTARIAVNEDHASRAFVKASLESPVGKRQILDCQKEGAQPVVSCQDLIKFFVPYPPCLEQRAIAEALNDVGGLLASLDRLIAKKRGLKQAAMQQLLTGQIRLPRFSREWGVKRLGDHVTFLRNGVNSRAELQPDGPLKYLHYGDVHASKDVFVSPDTLPCLPVEKATSLDRLQDGDLIFADASEDKVGVSKSVEVRGLGTTNLVSGLHTIAARFDKAVLADGFKSYLQYCPLFAAQLRRLAAGTQGCSTL